MARLAGVLLDWARLQMQLKVKRKARQSQVPDFWGWQGGEVWPGRKEEQNFEGCKELHINVGGCVELQVGRSATLSSPPSSAAQVGLTPKRPREQGCSHQNPTNPSTQCGYTGAGSQATA